MTKATTDAPEDEAVATQDEAPPEEKVCVNCGEPAVYESPADGNMNVVLLCAAHRPVNAPK